MRIILNYCVFKILSCQKVAYTAFIISLVKQKLSSGKLSPMVNIAWDDPSYPPTFIGPLDQSMTWVDDDEEPYTNVENSIFRLYRDNDLPALRDYILSDVQKTYWGWQRIMQNRKHLQGYEDIPYIMWAGMMYHPGLWGSIPAYEEYVAKFLNEEYQNAENGLKMTLLHLYLNDDDWNSKNGEFYRNELLHVVMQLWQEETIDSEAVLKEHYVKLLQGYQQNMTEDIDGKFLAWMISLRFLVKEKMLQEGEPILKDIMRNGSVRLVSGVVPLILRDLRRYAVYFEILKERNDALSAPMEWLLPVYGDGIKLFEPEEDTQ